MSNKRGFPLDRIPSSGAIETRLADILEEASKLRILLRTAKEIEAVSIDAKDISDEFLDDFEKRHKP